MNALVRILNASPRTRQAVALSIAAGVLAVAVLTVMFSAEALSAARQNVTDRRETLGQLLAIVALAKSVEESQSVDPPNAADEFLTGDSDALIQSTLQARLGEIAAANSVTVVSVGVAANGLDGDENYIGLRANLSGSVEGIHNTILALETNKPFLFIREAKLRSTNVPVGGVLTAPIELFAELTFYGARKIALAGGSP